MTREEKYIAQMKELGIWDEAFRPEVAELAQLEREKKRIKDAWAATVPKGCKPSFTDPHYALLVAARREILAHREALGLTPKSLRKLRGSSEGAAPIARDLLTERLEEIARRTAAYSGGVEAVPNSGLLCDE